MAVKTMEDLFLHTLKDVYHAEKQVLKALPKMAKKAGSPELKQAFETHRTETEGQVERLEKVFELVGKRAQGKPCAAMEGLIEESKEAMEEIEDKDVLDAALLSDAQAVEHYEITRYGTMIAWAQQLGMDEAVGLLEQTLAEEKKTDELLNKLALANVNKKAKAKAA
ncbi:ferritin-like domain-containing protein [Terrihabitans rhizophilus]|jgi:ferritin-like metal-binding protein YciE|uniref:Ferritin-like domain-containing protein n=1 Tax=Terrihabitans rhizophilus TaxID=3092662 RepID=A0ABU4RKI7_9HYPH|nr:ferritin-like domain-containing protein [Terrihabitans sp. PJ23]MDX6805340.1 ferritin-like domain-containing protein [Terrihabitans sp. PJ23]